MALYDYNAKTRDGGEVNGVVNADNESLATATLSERGFFDVELSEHERPQTIEAVFERLRRVSRKDVVIFSRQLSVLVSANVPMVKALDAAAKQTINPRLREIIEDIAGEVEGGAKLSESMGAYPNIFSGFIVNMIRSGETSGQLSGVLEYLADQEEKDYDLVAKIRGAMMYPAFIVAGLVVVAFVIVTWVLPKLMEIMLESGAELPLSTKILIAISSFFAAYWWLVILLVTGGVVGLRFAIKQPFGQAIWDTIKIKVPIFGGLFKRIALVRFSRSMETLLSGGVDEVTSIGISADVVGNRVYKDILLRTQKEVEDGNSIVTVMSGNPAVPVMMTQMLAIGEETGKTREVLQRLTDFYSREIDNLIANLTTLIEPIIMVIMGIAVGGMVAAVMLPMYNLANSF